jgi:AcrR family transcriptional regulator
MSSAVSTEITGGQVKPKPGRPQVLTADERYRCILAAAEQIFTNEGYGAATMEGISRTAGMSKRSVYRLFPDKEHLLVALVSDSGAFPATRDEPHPVPACPREAFRAQLLAMMPRQVHLTRLLISEAGRSPSLADVFHERVMRKGQVYLAAGLARLKESEPRLNIDDPESLSMTIFSAALGDLHIRALLGKPVAVNTELLLARIDVALRIILPGLQE